jgi:hypothetical protein
MFRPGLAPRHKGVKLKRKYAQTEEKDKFRSQASLGRVRDERGTEIRFSPRIRFIPPGLNTTIILLPSTLHKLANSQRR